MGNIIERVNVAGTTYDIASTAYAVCNNAAAEGKIINIDGFSLVTGVTIHVKFVNANTDPAPKLTISGGDSAANNPIPISGITTWEAGAVLTLTYDGSNWVRDYVETIANNITGSGTQNYLTKFSGTNTITNGPALTSSYDSSTVVTTSHKFLREDGTWVVPKYTSNIDTKLRVYLSTNSVELPLVGLNSGNATAAYASHTSGTKDVYGAIPSTAANRATINPSTGAITAPGGLIGNASTATNFATAKTIALTGDVTGSATGGNNGGWSIATTIATGAVTNDMLAGSIANGKLANDWIKIGNTTKHLGETFSLADLGIAAAMNFKGTTTTNLTDGDDTSPISIGGSNYTPVNGDVVLNGGKEFVWTGTAWEELGDESSWALSNDVIHISGAKGDIIYWSDTNSPTHLTAGTNGQVLKLANGVPTWAADSDTKVTQAYNTSANSFPLLFSNTSGITSTSSRGATTALVNNSIYVQPSTGTLHATKFVGDGSELTNIIASSIDWSDVNNKVFANLYINDTAAGTNSNAATTNDDTYIHLYDNNTKRDTIKLVGAKGASISANDSGVITITSLKYKSSGSANALTSLSLKYIETNGTTQHTETVTNAANTATAVGTVTDAVLYIKSIYYETTSVSTGVSIDNT